jgi:hypothetical protein
MNKLEDITVDGFWDFYCKTFPPLPDLPAEDLQIVKNFYMSGLAAMLALTNRLRVEPVERQHAILDKLYAELVAMVAPPSMGVLN